MTKSVKCISTLILFFFLFLHVTNGCQFSQNNLTLRDKDVEVRMRPGEGTRKMYPSTYSCGGHIDCKDFCKSEGYRGFKCTPKKTCTCFHI
uniref:Nodule-specific protein n=1 Tax=Astragalus sinicus TaxID=47065 RepID=Q07A30_ASTSI|nr:nodule-specific protein [Astragalus sinicus]